MKRLVLTLSLIILSILPLFAQDGESFSGVDDAETGESSESVSAIGEDYTPYDDPYSEQSQFRFHWNGFLRTLSSAVQDPFPGERNFLYSQEWKARLNTELEWKELSLQFTPDVTTSFSNQPGSIYEHQLFYRRDVHSWFGLEKIVDNDDMATRTALHRGSIAWRGSHANISAGRLGLSWGQGRLLNPIDVITPIDPTIYNLEDVPGADGVLSEFFFGAYSSVSLAVVPYRRTGDDSMDDVRAEDATFIARTKTTVLQSDVSFYGGRQGRSTLAMFDSSVSLWDASWRLAWVGRDEDEYTSPFTQTKVNPAFYSQVLAGTSYAFWSKLRATIEVFYSEAALEGEREALTGLQEEINYGLAPASDEDISFFLTQGRILLPSHTVLQGSLGYDLFTVLSLNSFIFWETETSSGLAGVYGSYSASDTTDLSAGFQKGWEDYETYQQLFLLAHWYF